MIFLVVLLVAAAHASPAYHNPMINPELFEGDIMGIDPDADRNAIPLDSQRWIEGIIPYEVDLSLFNYKELINDSMKHIEDRTCIRFVPKKDSDNDYIHIFSGSGCYSFWGRIGNRQYLSLGSGCLFKGTVVHELMHAIGFLHEQNRSDRDDYLTVNYENISERWHDAFRKVKPSENRLLTPFDYESIMLYGERAFSRKWNLKSMEAKDGRFLPEVYTKKGLSESDTKRVNMLYECKNI